jgi:hypothetical protein
MSVGNVSPGCLANEETVVYTNTTDGITTNTRSTHRCKQAHFRRWRARTSQRANWLVLSLHGDDTHGYITPIAYKPQT